MKTLTFALPDHDLPQLHEELMAAIPACCPMLDAETKYFDREGNEIEPPHGRMVPSMTLEAKGNQVTLTVPDEVDEAAVQAVVAAHTPKRERQKTDQEYAAEFQDPLTTELRKQEIVAIKLGLLPREEVPLTTELRKQEIVAIKLGLLPREKVPL